MVAHNSIEQACKRSWRRTSPDDRLSSNC